MDIELQPVHWWLIALFCVLAIAGPWIYIENDRNGDKRMPEALAAVHMVVSMLLGMAVLMTGAFPTLDRLEPPDYREVLPYTAFWWSAFFACLYAGYFYLVKHMLWPRTAEPEEAIGQGPREFPLHDVLSLTTGRMILPVSYEIVNYMTGWQTEDLTREQQVELMQAAAKAILAQRADLTTIVAPPEGPVGRETLAWFAYYETMFGATVTLQGATQAYEFRASQTI